MDEWEAQYTDARGRQHIFTLLDFDRVVVHGAFTSNIRGGHQFFPGVDVDDIPKAVRCLQEIYDRRRPPNLNHQPMEGQLSIEDYTHE